MRNRRRVRAWGGVSFSVALVATTLAVVPPGAPVEAGPAPTPATIVVRKAGDRTGIGLGADTTPLQGAQFAAYAKGNNRNQTIPAGQPTATCTTDVNGECTLTVPSSSARYLVVETAAPAGWSVIDQIALGRFNASGTNRAYRWNVGVAAGETTQIPETDIINSSTQTWPERPDPSGPLTVADYRWANVRDNPLLDAQKCGLNIALIFDQSGSIGTNQPLVQNAAVEFVEDLTGTPTEIATFTFSTNSPSESPGSQNRPNLISIADQSGADQVISNINGLGNPGGGTNWDYALRQVANAAPAYDLAIMLTDGNPTAWRGETSSTGDVNDYDVEEAVHSANWLKSLGTRVVSIGFSGSAGGLTATNLALISGPQQGDPSDPEATDDYFLTTFGELADLLSLIALNSCGGTISVSKKISPTWNDIDSVDLEPNWPFASGPNQPWLDPQSGQTEANGAPLQFTVSFEQGTLERDVTILEPTLGPNLPIADPAGKNARCTITGSSDPESRVDNVSNNGVTIRDVTDKEIVSCLFVNSPLQLLAEKYLDVEGDGQRDPSDPPLEGWTIFIDDNGNSVLDTGEASGVTDANGQVLFDRLPGEGTYRVCEVLQSGFVNTDPGGGALCKDQLVEFPTQPVDPVPPAGPVEFGNVEAGSYTITKGVDDGSGFVPLDTEFTVRVDCQFNGQPVDGFPRDYTLEDGDTVSVGPLFDGTSCTITEPGNQGADVTITPSTVDIPDDDGVQVFVDNAYPAGDIELRKVVDGPLAGIIPAGTAFTVEVTCRFPTGFPVQGVVPGYNPLEVEVLSGANGQPGPPVDIGPLPDGTTCDFAETDDNGATVVEFTPSDQIVVDASQQGPIEVVVTNTFNPAALRIWKVIDSSGAQVPPDTEFEAAVTCTFNTETTFDETVTFGIGEPNAYIVDDQPVGASCFVEETNDQGASDTTYQPSQTVILEGPTQPVSVDMTITNTFAPGSLEISKDVEDDGTGLVPPGTQFTVNVDCVFAGGQVDGYPQDIVVTTPNDLTETLEGIPAGAECTVTETDSAGASDISIEPDQPVTITPESEGTVEVTVTNEFETDQFLITKDVVDPSGLVPSGTQFVVDITCSYPPSWPASGEIPGFDPRMLTIEDGDFLSSGQLPVGSTCTITESDQQGAGSVVITPDTITVGEQGGPTLVTVENSYPVGALLLRKAVDDGGEGFIPPGTPYTVNVDCTYPAGYPAQGDIPGFSPLSVVLLSGVAGGPGLPVRVGEGGLPNGNGGLPVGAECTISEPDPEGADDVVITPDPTATVTDDLQDPVEVLVTNVYDLGNGEIVKVTTGPLAGELIPAGTPFTVEATCSYPSDFPGGLGGNPIPGFNPLELEIIAGPPDQAGPPTPFGPLPLGTPCTFVETGSNGASTITIEPDNYTIDSTTVPATATVTNAYEEAGLLISKIINGPGAPLVPPGVQFPVRVVCTWNGPSGPDGIDVTVPISAGSPVEISGILVGATCEVTETDSLGADVSINPSGEFVVEGATDPVLVDVTITNTFAVGELTITKDVTGELADLVPDGTEYLIVVSCSLGGVRLPGYPTDVVLTTPNGLSETITGLPVGAECFASETDTNGAVSPPTFVPPYVPRPQRSIGSVPLRERDDRGEPARADHDHRDQPLSRGKRPDRQGGRRPAGRNRSAGYHLRRRRDLLVPGESSGRTRDRAGLRPTRTRRVLGCERTARPSHGVRARAARLVVFVRRSRRPGRKRRGDHAEPADRRHRR